MPDRERESIMILRIIEINAWPTYIGGVRHKRLHHQVIEHKVWPRYTVQVEENTQHSIIELKARQRYTIQADHSRTENNYIRQGA